MVYIELFHWNFSKVIFGCNVPYSTVIAAKDYYSDNVETMKTSQVDYESGICFFNQNFIIARMSFFLWILFAVACTLQIKETSYEMGMAFFDCCAEEKNLKSKLIN